MSDEEETEYDIPEWSPAFLGWYYEITTYDDGTAAIEQLPDFISIEFDGEGLWTLKAELGDGGSLLQLELEDEDLDGLIEEADEALSPLQDLFV